VTALVLAVSIYINRATSDSASDSTVRLPDGTCLPHSHRGWRQFHRDQYIYARSKSINTDCYAAAGFRPVMCICFGLLALMYLFWQWMHQAVH